MSVCIKVIGHNTESQHYFNKACLFSVPPTAYGSHIGVSMGDVLLTAAMWEIVGFFSPKSLFVVGHKITYTASDDKIKY